VRFRTTEYRQIIEVHRLFPSLTSVSEAHSLTPEESLAAELGTPAELLPHLESLEDNGEVHHHRYYTGKREPNPKHPLSIARFGVEIAFSARPPMPTKRLSSRRKNSHKN
jgi:hypothetical protein